MATAYHHPTRMADPGQSFTDQAWVSGALCSETNPDAFHPDQGESNTTAKRVCDKCDVQVQCLEWALRTNQQNGVWGGLNERERRRLLKRNGGDVDRIMTAAGRPPTHTPNVDNTGHHAAATTTGSGSYVAGGTHIPIPTTPNPLRGRQPAKPRPTGLDWSKHTSPDPPPPPPRVELEEPPPRPTPARHLNRVEDILTRIPTPTPTPPAAVDPAPPDDVTRLLAETANHPHPAVQAARDTVLAAIAGLHRVHNDPTPTAVDTPDNPTAWRRLTKREQVMICARYQRGESTIQLATAYGISRSGINRVLVRHNVTLRGPHHPHQPINQVGDSTP